MIVKMGKGRKLFFSCVRAVLFLLMGMAVSIPLRAAGEQNPMQAQITADIAAGKDIASIIQQAVAGRMTVANAVGSIVTAGVDPGRVAYIAITAKFSAESVVQGAVTTVSKMGLSEADFRTALTLICSSAIQAGAHENQVARGAANAGAPNTAIANAIAQAMMPPAPAFGHSKANPYGPNPRWNIHGSSKGAQSIIP